MSEKPPLTLVTDETKHHRLTRQMTEVEARSRILRLIRNGASAEQAAEILSRGDNNFQPYDVGPQTVRKMVKDHLENLHREDAITLEELRVLENQRLDHLYAQVMKEMNVLNELGEVVGTNMKAVDRLVKISERRSKMNGLDAPKKLVHELQGLRALGIEEEHQRRADEAWRQSGGVDGSIAEDHQLPAGAPAE